MDTDELAKTYGQEAVDGIVISELYSSLDCTNIETNVYQIPDPNAGEDEEQFITITFDKFFAEWAPFVEGADAGSVDPVEEGEEPTPASPEGMARGVAEHIYNSFSEAANSATYVTPDQDGVRGAIGTYRKYTNREPSVLVVDDDLLSDDEITAIEEFEDITIYESEYLDLGEELLISNEEIGYSAIRTEVDSQSWIDGPHGVESSLDNPLVTSIWTRRGVTETNPEYGLTLTPIGEINRKI